MRSARPASRRSRKSRSAFATLAKSAKEDDVVFVVLIGHGTFDGKVAKFNLPGPGHDAGELRAAAEELAVEAHRLRQHRELERAVPRGAVRTRAHDRDRHAHRRRTIRDALRRLLRRRADERHRGRRQEPPRLGARGVRRGKARAWRAPTSRKGIMLTEHPLLDDSGDKKGDDRSEGRRQERPRRRRSLRSAPCRRPTRCRRIRRCARSTRSDAISSGGSKG